MTERDVEHLVELSIDGELDPSEEARLAAALERSEVDRQRAEAARYVHRSLKEKLKAASDDAATPPSLKARVTYQLRREAVAIEESLFPWGRAVAATLAVALLVIVAFVKSVECLDPEEYVAVHASNHKPDVEATLGLERVRQHIQQHIGVLMKVAQPDENDLRLLGVRTVNLGRRKSAYLMYDRRGVRISVFASPGTNRNLSPPEFRPAQRAGRELYLGEHRGYRIVSFSKGDLEYSIVGDAETEDLVELASAF